MVMSLRFIIKFADLQYQYDDNMHENDLSLHERIAPRIYGFEVMTVFNKEVSLLLLEREDTTIRDKFWNMSLRLITPNLLNDFVLTIEKCWNLFLVAVYEPFCFKLGNCHVNLASLHK